ncbi:type VI secretion system Vgr family protein [Pseudomonas sp. PDM13]|uniref:type VI secretion system Vgr family protein n=1 Tax=Pseudomonas sp. PDM13 TaxID=2769255 RepID=UPI0021DF6528|nr:type VI secretion system Vgr family protein [Pseudomonas sp. PDM13]MCU9949060.1 type VI secretion system tip protein VgrG [Pseudomonas sp. PDM13]
MLAEIRPFFDHSRHRIQVRDLDALLDVLAFRGEEALSEPFAYQVEFTSTQRDLPAEQLLGRGASFSLLPPPVAVPFAGMSIPPTQPLRTLHGVVTGFRRLSGSNDEARYELTLQPRLALLGRGRQYRIYQHLSVPEIVEQILRSDRHRWAGQDFFFDLKREYPKREQVMQYGESDLAFIGRLLAEVGIWYRFTADERLNIDVVEFHDDQRNYQFGAQLPYRPQSGTNSTGQDAVWDLQSSHGVVESSLRIRAYTPRDAAAYLDGELDQTRGDPTTYGEAYHYAEPYIALDDPHAQDEDLQSESGYFYARLAHERYLNGQTRLAGTTSSAALAAGQVLKVEGGAPAAFAPGAVITRLVTTAARDRSFEARFDAIPYSDSVCFRSPLLPRPVIAGTIPARVTSPQPDDLYGHIDLEGRYKVNFLFDQDTWPAGQESMWLRLARPYAGDTYGLHLPLVQGTEVGIAFEHGDPDRGFIAFALHDSRHPDLVTLQNYKRNVLRTPANNKLRLDDTRGQEHIKLSTEHSGKSQLNLGHLVDGQRQKRGEGFELRTDGRGALRSGKGMFISADEQPRAQGQVLAMEPATGLVESALQQMTGWRDIADTHRSQPPAIDGLAQLHADARGLAAPAILLSAPRGIGAVTSAGLLLKSGHSLYVQSQEAINLAAAQRLLAHASQGISLLAQQEGMRLVSGKGPLEIESHGDRLDLIAQQDITVQSAQGHLQLTAKNGITLACGGGYIRITPGGAIDIHSPGKLNLKGQHVWEGPAGQGFPLPELPTSVCEDCLKKAQAQAAGAVMRMAG